MIDFDKMFERYLTQWYAKHASDFENIEEMEEKMQDVFEMWSKTPLKELNNQSPAGYFESISSADTLIKMLIESSAGEMSPSMLLTERISAVKECAEGLKEIISGNFSVNLKMTAVNLLNDTGAAQPFEIYAGWITAEEIDESLKELAVEMLSDNADAAAPFLFPQINSAKLNEKINIAEVLCNAKRDERTFMLLKELFESKINTPLVAGYLGKYGDERAAGLLYPALSDCNYFEYIEIKNAIERLGGIVEDERDFTDDPYYKAIKGVSY